MPNILKLQARISGTINDSPLEAEVKGLSDLRTGIMEAELNISTQPNNFVPIAASGLSWLCWKNNAVALAISPRAMNLMELSNGNYNLARRNQFPDGSFIEMSFEVRRMSQDSVQAVGKWNGSYGLSSQIVGIESPIVEEMSDYSSGTILSHYTYALIDENGNRHIVETPSTYKFDSAYKTVTSIQEPQRRTMTFAVEEKIPHQQYRLQSHSCIDIVSGVTMLHASAESEGFGVVVKV